MLPNQSTSTMSTKRNAKDFPVEPEEPAGTDFINKLSDDCLARIFMYLPIRDRLSVQAVCRRWRNKSELIWGDLRTLDSTSHELSFALWNNKGIGRILRESGRFLEQLKLSSCCTSLIFPLIAECCHNLTRLEIKLPFSDMTCTKWCPQMDRLEYFKMKGNSHHFSDNFFPILQDKCLTELHLSVTFFNNEHTHAPRVALNVIKKGPKLSVLSLKGFFLGSSIMLQLNQRHNLTFLALEKCSVMIGHLRLSLLINLEHLSLSRTSDVDDHLVTQVAAHCKKLKYLNLTGCELIGDAGILELRKLSVLEELVLNCVYRVTDAPLSEMSNLKRLECRSCCAVTGDGIITLIKCAPNLEYLNLYGSGVSEKVVIEAAEIVRQRSNGIGLRILIQSCRMGRCDYATLSPLVIEHCHSDHSSDASYDVGRLSDFSDIDDVDFRNNDDDDSLPE